MKNILPLPKPDWIRTENGTENAPSTIRGMGNNFESKHPRSGDGKFTEKARKESGLELTLGPSDWEEDIGLVKGSIPKDTGKAGDKVLEQMEKDNPDTDDYLYGPAGWTRKTGAIEAIKDYLDTSVTMGNYGRFSKLDSEGAEKLLASLPSITHQDRQNDAPTLGTMLAACAANPGKVSLSGYTIDDSRWDERVSVDTIHIADPEAVEGTRLSGQQLRDKWHEYQEQLGLDAREAPDEIYSTGGEEPGWEMWWD